MIVGEQDGPGPLFEFIHDQIYLPYSSDLVCIGWQRQDLSIAGVVAYNMWLEESCFMHVAFDSHSVSRQMLSEAFRYPFVTCGKSRVYGLTPITSERALRFSQRLGFRLLMDTEDFRLQVITREECRWINDSAGTRSASSNRIRSSADLADWSIDTAGCSVQ